MFRLMIGLLACLYAAIAPATAETVPVRIGYIPVLGTAQVFVANREGWLKDAGLDVRFIPFDSGPNMIQGLASGKLEIYVAGVAPLAVARSKGVDVKVVAATAIEEMTTVAGPRLAAFFKPGVSPADAFKAFAQANGRPASMATQPPGSVPHTTLNHWLFETSKVATSDVRIITMGIDATQQAVLAGAVDGATLREPAVTIVRERDPHIKIVALGGDMFPSQPGTVIAIQGAFLKAHPVEVEKLVAAIIRANDQIQADPASVVPAIEASLGKGLVSNDLILAALRSPASKFTVDPDLIVASTKAMQAYQVKLGTLDKEYPLDDLFDDSFYKRAMSK
ncbi:ABC transporter substrate-binding protein [Lichenifustis flavocetrariae]|uniref:ABC transporter substrate-binding protein n=1 Tax=Lichenifustis flavocetrariae TaxID=2949735 RepID=A0AA41YYU0_9HYPH|nr:ABC transporter substrate-binding protein [Lichenifustis flavocetrariae]MCW6507330.1 ABC transporter substrate-binding protein [Lichenifustis flavocetrariae]